MSSRQRSDDPHFYCKKQKKFAWAKYYEAMGQQADNAAVILRQVPQVRNNRGTITVENIPAHFSAEFVEMAKELRKEFSCPICFELVNSDTIAITSCGHIYCKECLDTLKRQAEPKCAMCRRALPATE